MTTKDVAQADRGVVYVAVGSKYLAEAEQSAASLKAQTPHMPVTVFTNVHNPAKCFDQALSVGGERYHQTMKARCLLRSPYARTLFLDTDTYVCANLDGLFTLLERFDLAAAHANARLAADDRLYLSDMVAKTPLVYPEFNGGVLLLKRTPAVQRMLAEWITIIERNERAAKERGSTHLNDQTALREAVYYSDLQTTVLTPEYNCRGRVGFVSGQVQILHGHSPDLAAEARAINRSDQARVFIRNGGRLRVVVGPRLGWKELASSLRRRGLAATLAAMLRRLRGGAAAAARPKDSG
jgi:hypothetical protein